jgi:hypothetical protein
LQRGFLFCFALYFSDSWKLSALYLKSKISEYSRHFQFSLALSSRAPAQFQSHPCVLGYCNGNPHIQYQHLY